MHPYPDKGPWNFVIKALTFTARLRNPRGEAEIIIQEKIEYAVNDEQLEQVLTQVLPLLSAGQLIYYEVVRMFFNANNYTFYGVLKSYNVEAHNQFTENLKSVDINNLLDELKNLKSWMDEKGWGRLAFEDAGSVLNSARLIEIVEADITRGKMGHLYSDIFKSGLGQNLYLQSLLSTVIRLAVKYGLNKLPSLVEPSAQIES